MHDGSHSIFGWMRTCAVSLAGIVCFILDASLSAQDTAALDDIRIGARAQLLEMANLQYEYEVMDLTGWEAEGEFIGEGAKFRVIRRDRRAKTVGDRNLPLLSSSAAFNGQRQQSYDDTQNMLRVADGNMSAAYNLDTLQTIQYGWLTCHPEAESTRFDSILDADLWAARFAGANYDGSGPIDDRVAEIVSFVQSEELRVPSVFIVYFAKDLAYFPFKYDRLVEATGELAARVAVTAFEVVESGGVRIPVATEIESVRTGADGLPAARLTMRVKDNSLVVNGTIDATVFDLQAPEDAELYDVNVWERRHAPTPTTASVLQPDMVVARWRPRTLLILANCGAIVIIVALVLGRRWLQGRR